MKMLNPTIYVNGQAILTYWEARGALLGLALREGQSAESDSFLPNYLLAPALCQALSLVLGQKVLTRCIAEGTVLVERAANVLAGRVQDTQGT